MKLLGILLMVIGVAGFFGGNMLKSKNRVLEEKVTKAGRQVIKLPVNADKSYTVLLWGRGILFGIVGVVLFLRGRAPR